MRGDYEDSHLCLQLLEQGRENWYLPDAELYHLEAQSYSSEARGDSNRFNMWLYTRIWSDRIESLMRGSTTREHGRPRRRRQASGVGRS